MTYAGVTFGDLYHGNMRFDVNISIAPVGSEQLGTRAEVKNLNSFRSVEKAAEYEFNRQVELLEKGEKVVQETRGWDDAKMRTSSQRGKEEAHDYRYMPEPDVPPVELSQGFVDEIKSKMPLLPPAIRQKMLEVGVSESRIEMLIAEPQVANFVISLPKAQVTTITNWLASDINRAVADGVYDWTAVIDARDNLTKLSAMFNDKKLNSSAAKELLGDVITGGDPEQLAADKNLLQVSDESAIDGIVKGVLAENEQAANDVKNGEMKAIGFLVGQVMKASRGQANPALAQQLIKKHLQI